MFTPYLIFNGDCQDALDFYSSVFPCGELKFINYGDYMPKGSKAPPKVVRTWVMHGEMEVCGTKIWFADEATPFTKGESIKLSASIPTGKEAAVIFNALCPGGTVTLSPTETFYSVFHAAVTDKLCVSWNVVAMEQPVRK